MLRKLLRLAAAVPAATLVAMPLHQALAADLTVGVGNWPSARASAYLLGTVIEDRLGLEVDYVEGTPAELFEKMDAGEVDLFPEVWMPNHRYLVADYVEKRGSVEMASRGIPAEQGICTTRQTAEAYGISSVFDLKKPEIAAELDTNQDSRGEMWIGAPGWEATRIERVRAKSYGYDLTMDLLEIDERTAMAAVDVAVAVEAPIVFYCYEPHHLFQLHEIVKLDEPAHDPTKWNIRNPDEPDWLENSEAASAYGLSFIHPAYAADLDETYPEVRALVEKLDLNTDVLSEMSYALVVERRDPAEFAAEWAQSHRDRVDRWTN